MNKLYLPNKEKTSLVYQVVSNWQGEGGSWEHGWYESALFKNKEDAERFLIEVAERWEAGDFTSDLGKNFDHSKPRIETIEILEEYASPENGDDFQSKTYFSHVCRED